MVINWRDGSGVGRTCIKGVPIGIWIFEFLGNLFILEI